MGCLDVYKRQLYQVPGLVDSWIIHMKKQHPALNYGLPRGTGSLVFAATAQIMGTVTVLSLIHIYQNQISGRFPFYTLAGGR